MPTKTEDDLKRLNADMDARLRGILEQAPPDLRGKMEEAGKQRRSDTTRDVDVKELANAAQRAAQDLEAAASKADKAMADYQKVKDGSKIPLWIGAMAVAAFVAFLVYAART